MPRLLRIYRQFLRSSLQANLEFKANFYANLVQNVLWVAFFILLLKIVYTNTTSVAGWSEGDSYVLAASVFFTYSTLIAFTSSSLMEMPEKVRKGMLDFDLLKPVDTQFLVSVRKFNFDEFGSIASGFVMLAVGLSMVGHVPTLVQAAAYIAMLAFAVLIFYSFHLIIMTLGIWLVRVDNLWVLGETIYSIARFPMDIFRSPLKTILTFYIPIAFVATVPTQVFLGRAPLIMVAYAALWAAAFLWISRSFWKFALSQYSSASS